MALARRASWVYHHAQSPVIIRIVPGLVNALEVNI